MGGVNSAIEKGTREGIESASQAALDKYEIHTVLRQRAKTDVIVSKQTEQAPVPVKKEQETIKDNTWKHMVLFLFAILISVTCLYWISSNCMSFVLEACMSDKVANPYFIAGFFGILWAVQIRTVCEFFNYFRLTFFGQNNSRDITGTNNVHTVVKSPHTNSALDEYGREKAKLMRFKC